MASGNSVIKKLNKSVKDYMHMNARHYREMHRQQFAREHPPRPNANKRGPISLTSLHRLQIPLPSPRYHLADPSHVLLIF